MVREESQMDPIGAKAAATRGFRTGLGVGVDGGASAVSAAPAPMAVLGYDGILHGTRNGGSTKPVGLMICSTTLVECVFSYAPGVALV